MLAQALKRQGQEFTRAPASEEIRARLHRLGRREWWLWFSATTITLLAVTAFLLLSLPWLSQGAPQVSPEQLGTGLLGLVLLFNAFATYRQWQFRKQRCQLFQKETTTNDSPEELAHIADLDLTTGLPTRHHAAELLAKEILRSRRDKKPLTFLVLDLDDFGQLNQQHGRAFGDLVLQEFAKRLKRASRGSDLAIRLGSDEFLLVLPECGGSGAQRVLERLSPVNIHRGGRKLTLRCSASSLEYGPGELPEDVLRRADQVLRLYKQAGQATPATLLAN